MTAEPPDPTRPCIWGSVKDLLWAPHLHVFGVPLPVLAALS